MRQRYVVYDGGKAIGWVHATTAEEAIQKVRKMTGRVLDGGTAVRSNAETTRIVDWYDQTRGYLLALQR